MRRILAALAVVLLSGLLLAQSAPNWPRDYLPGPGEVNGAFAGKQDVGGPADTLRVTPTGGTNGTLGAVVSGQAPITGMNIAPDAGAGQLITVAPTGNTSPATLASLNVQANARSATMREFMVNLGFTSGLGGSTPNADKVGIYVGMTCNPGSGNCWAMNPLGTGAAGYSGSVQTIEADLNNLSGTSVNTDVGGALRTAVAANGVALPGSYNTAGFSVLSVNSTQLWHYGFLAANNSVKDATFYDLTTGNYSYLNAGNHPVAVWGDSGTSPVGLILAGTYSNAAIDTSTANVGPLGALHMRNNQAITAQNAAGTANVSLLRYTPSGTTEVGIGTPYVVVPSMIETISATPPGPTTGGCAAGQHSWDTYYEYRCIGSNTWKRIPLQDWPVAAWTCSTVTPTAATGTFTAATAQMCSTISGKTVQLRARVSITNNGSAAGAVFLPTPYQAANDTIFVGKEIGSTSAALTGQVNGVNTQLNIVRYDGAYPGANGYLLIVSGSYESLF